MDERLLKQSRVAESLLRDAAAELAAPQVLPGFERLICRSEFALALAELATLGDAYPVSAEYWRLLEKTAEVLGLAVERKAFSMRYRAARSLEHT
ncbi:hypothetical protein DF3PB_220042 [uncultured Defluviicoccus sp.]|uniref:Uncharacterized protein n=1 Tax=metagenome TaxID=256318 RepID=A0A380TDY8_9ZZZZ|nr:hypothetical protein DF3PB_220042 [uncultured Defluviicoccus sp.]